jgi:signal peptidase I
MPQVRREVFEGSDGLEIWVEGRSTHDDSNILLTISNQHGENTALITSQAITPSKAKLFVEAPPERVATPTVARYQKIRAVMKWSAYVSAALLLTFSFLSFTGTLKARIVLTGSMAPVIHTGDVIITTSPAHKAPKKGDIIAYTARRFNGAAVATISHRIIGGDATKGFIVKGDHNPSPDVQHPGIGDISGVVILIIPFIGNLLTPKALFLIVPCVFGFWLILDAMKNAE